MTIPFGLDLRIFEKIAYTGSFALLGGEVFTAPCFEPAGGLAHQGVCT
jgi:hypothetical protein